jgi:predicted RNase H-like nuclease (RuvC/YqgF family)
MSDKTLEDIYTEGLFDRIGARTAGTKARIGAIGRNLGKVFTGGSTENVSEAARKAKLESIIKTFQSEMQKLFGSEWTDTYKNLADSLDFALLDIKKPATPASDTTASDTTAPDSTTDTSMNKTPVNPKLSKAKEALKTERTKLKKRLMDAETIVQNLTRQVKNATKVASQPKATPQQKRAAQRLSDQLNTATAKYEQAKKAYAPYKENLQGEITSFETLYEMYCQ